METTINQKPVTISSRDKTQFTYDGVGASKLKELNETLYNEVSKKVIHYVDNKEKIDEEARQKEIEEAKVEQIKKLEELKEKIFALDDVDLTGFEVSYHEPTGESYFKLDVRVQKIGCGGYTSQFAIEYNDKVSSGGFYTNYRTTTNKVWKMEFDYKITRYAKLENALKKGMEKVNEKIEDEKLEKIRKQEKNFEEKQLEKFAKDNGFKFEKDYHSYGRNNRGGYYVYVMNSGRVCANIIYDEDKKKVEITGYTVSKKENEEIIVEELKLIK